MYDEAPDEDAELILESDISEQLSSFTLAEDDVEEIPEEDEEQGRGDIGISFISSSLVKAHF